MFRDRRAQCLVAACLGVAACAPLPSDDTSTALSTRGDLNGDAAVNALDLQLMVNVILGTETSATVVAAADLNADSTVNALDLQAEVTLVGSGGGGGAVDGGTSGADAGTTLQCAAGTSWSGLGGRTLETDPLLGTRVDNAPTSDQARVKPYEMLAGEYQRVLGTTPAFIQNRAALFGQAPARFFEEPKLSAVGAYAAFTAAFQGCLTYTASATNYGTNPTATTAATECQSFATKFWSRTATTAEVNACVAFATGAANNDTNPRRRWAYTCAAVLTAAGFLSY